MCSNGSLSQTVEQLYTEDMIPPKNVLIQDRCITKTMADCGDTNSNMSIAYAHSDFEIIIESENVLYRLSSRG